MRVKTILFYFSFVFAYTFNSYAQENLLFQNLQKAKDSGEKFIPVSAFTEVSVDTKHKTKIQERFIKPSEVSILRYSKQTAKNLSKTITMAIPFNGKELQLEIQEISLDYTLRTSSGHVGKPNNTIKHYRGVVKDDPNSIVALTFGEDEVMGIIAIDEGNLNLALDKQLGDHILYNDLNMKQKPIFECNTTDDYHPMEHYRSEILMEPSKSTANNTSSKAVRFYLETEFDIFQARGNVSAVETFITGLYNQIAILYQNENINTSLSEIFVWNTTDPYTSTTTSGLLTQFQNQRTSFNGDLGQLLTFRNIGGGLAAGINGLCNNNNSQKLAVSMLQNNFSNVPNYSFSIYVVTHEFGHLLGSPHTHACFWNGNNTAIDGCAGYTEGGCSLPSVPSKGTIMSYCHLGPGINFSLGFGQQPGNVIRNNVANASCLLSITGTTPICLSCGTTFTAANAPTGFTWDKSSNLSISGTGNTITVTPHNSGEGWVSVKLGATELVRYNLWVGKPVLRADWYYETMCRGESANYTVSTTVSPFKVGGFLENHNWWITGGTSSDYYALPDYNNFYVEWYNSGSYNIWVTADNICGTSDPLSFPIQISYCSPAPSPAYPNPVNNILNIKLEEPPINAKASTTYDVRLYNGQGNQVRQQNFKGGTVQLNVSNLPNGLYYIHIHDNSNNKPIVHTIIVKH